MRKMVQPLLIWLTLVPSILVPLSYSQEIIREIEVSIATSKSPLPISRTVFVVLTWPAAKDFTLFNLYRKESPLEDYLKRPINGDTPIAIMTDCDEIKTWAPEGSNEWQTIQKTIGTESNPFNPCLISDIPRGATEFERLQMIARSSWKVAVIVGQGYVDKSVTAGTTYYYELRGVSLRGLETVLATDITITAGAPAALPAPATIDAIADDNRVLVLWDDVENAAAFNIYRATDPVGAYDKVNETASSSRFEKDFNENDIVPPMNGFIDFQRWDEYGNPTTHDVNGVAIAGPQNETTYYYKISSLDLLYNEGPLSASFAVATPTDQTPPMTPREISITPNDPMNQLEIRWTKISYDVDGHADNVKEYKVYRYEIPDGTESVQVGAPVAQPGPGFEIVTHSDTDPVLRPLYGEKTFYYRIEAIDMNNNVSARSAVAAGYLNDVSPPVAPKNVNAEGFEDYIVVRWDLNTEPDMDGYLIYRSLCEFGEWTCVSEERRQRERDTKKECPEVFSLVGYVSQEDAAAIRATGIQPYFEDHTVDQASPICYAYLVKAIDKSQNQNGTLPPNPAIETVVCQRVRDKTPPDPAIITSLLARDNSIYLEWIGAPVQDIAAYHVYRSEKEEGPYAWVGGMTVERPPASPVPLAAPYAPPALVGCDDIPLLSEEYMSIGSLLDKPVDDKIIYWYKVLGIDKNGNESRPESAVGISTFTFSTDVPASPSITSVDVQSPTCALVVQWNPAYDATLHQGFVVFKSETAAGPYLQIGDIVIGNSLVDLNVVRGIEYWYRVLKIDRDGILSPPSASVSGKVLAE